MRNFLKTKYSNLKLHSSGIYHIHAKVHGQLIRESLHTDSATIAQAKRDIRLSELRKTTVKSNPETWAEASASWLTSIKASEGKPRTKEYKSEMVRYILESFPQFEQLNCWKISKDDCRRFAEAMTERFGATRFNGALQTFRAVMRHAGVSFDPACDVKQQRVRPRKAKLPDKAAFARLVAHVENSPWEKGSALTIRLLASSGMRCSEARYAQVEHANFKTGLLFVQGHPDPAIATKNGDTRYVPMNDSLKAVLRSLKGKRVTGPMLEAADCKKALENACRAVGCDRLTPHDLRDVFATTCIESGVDIPTVAVWLGHKDGGALLMKTYAHLRDDHSQAMARKVKF